MGCKTTISWHSKPPWRGHFFSHARTKDWLALLNFEIVATKKILFCPPLNRQSWLTRLARMDRWGKRLWPIFGGATVVVATKRTVPLTPIRSGWRYKQFFPSGRYIKKTVARWSSKTE